MLDCLELLRSGLVVSVQAAPGDPLEDTETIRRMAKAVAASGAVGLRVNSPEDVAAIRRDCTLPIIGIQKQYSQGAIHITPDFASAAALATAGASIIALDCTARLWPDGEPWRQLVDRIHRELNLPVMADVSTFEEALAATQAGADMVGTTLNGYTEETRHNHSFDWQLLEEMVRRIRVPVIAEGHIATPEEARRAISLGAWCVIVGSAITRPGVIAAKFANALRTTATAQAIGADIGGTSVKAALVYPDGKVTLETQVPTDARGGRSVIVASLCAAVEQVLSQAQALGIRPSGLGIASAGAIDARDGSIFAATDNLPGWAGFELRRYVEERFHLPTRVVNDAHAAVLAELRFGVGRSLTDFVAITIGTGIGGGIVSNRQLISGHHGFAGSIGHHVICAGGRACNCGRRGCLEAYVSTAALINEFKQQGGVIPTEVANQDADIAFHINQLCRQGNGPAVAAYQVMGDYLAVGVANIFNLFDPEAVLISGGLIEGQTTFVAEVEEKVAKILHFGAKRNPVVKAAAAGRFAGVQGAASLILAE